LILDWSGTLVDDLPAVWRASNHVFRLAGVPELTLDQFRAEFCLPFQHFYDRFVPHLPMAQLEAWFHSHFQVVQNSVRLLPHAHEFLGFCQRRGLRMFMLSTVRRDHFEAQSSAYGLSHFFEHVYVEVLDKRKKITELLRQHSLVAKETLFVGDMQHDVETAKHGRIYSCAVLTGYNRLEQLRASGPDLIVEHLGELREFLDRYNLEWHPQSK
jgi:phosphoglycolate phosphatase-like HAD superfamily hydrolase